MIFKFSEKGHCRKENQDFLMAKSNDKNTVTIIALADGAGSSVYSRIGAEIACLTACDELLNIFSNDEQNMTTGEMKYQVMSSVLRELNLFVNKFELKNDLRDVASTLLIFALEKKTGRYVCLHLGDGLILQIEKDDIRLLSGPSNGITKKFTDLTSSCNCIRKTRLYYGKAMPDETTGFIMFSDGAAELLWDGLSVQGEVADLMKNRRWRQLEEWLVQQQPEDDYSFIVLENQG